MSGGFTRITASDKTAALVQAMEMADDCDFLLVLYQGKEGSEIGQGFINCGEETQATLNWFVDRFKMWLLGPLREDDET